MKPNKWTDEELNIIRSNAREKTIDLLHLIPRHSENSINKKRYELGCSRMPQNKALDKEAESKVLETRRYQLPTRYRSLLHMWSENETNVSGEATATA